MAALHQSTAQIIPVLDGDESFSFDAFIDLSVDEASGAFGDVEDPDGDAAPFLTAASGGAFSIVVWHSLDDELQDRFVTHVVPPVIAAQHLDQVALVITTYLTPMTAKGAKRGERYEALMVAALSKHGDECALQAKIERATDRPPQLGKFEIVADTLPPTLAEPLRSGLFDALE